MSPLFQRSGRSHQRRGRGEQVSTAHSRLPKWSATLHKHSAARLVRLIAVRGGGRGREGVGRLVERYVGDEQVQMKLSEVTEDVGGVATSTPSYTVCLQ